MKNFKRIIGIICMLALLIPIAAQSADKPEKIPVGPNASNFVDNKDGTVTDKKTGLTWKQCPEGITGGDCAMGKADKFKWQFALDHAKSINEGEGFAGKKDWRVPTIEELATIVDANRKDPSINVTAFPNTPFDAFYWSSSITDDGKNACCYIFGIGKRLWSFKFDVGYLRLVRGEMKNAVKKTDEDKTDEKKKDSSKKNDKKTADVKTDVKTTDTKTDAVKSESEKK